MRAGVHVDRLSGAHGRDERRGRASAAGDGGGDGTRGRFRGGPVRVHEERAQLSPMTALKGWKRAMSMPGLDVSVAGVSPKLPVRSRSGASRA